MYELSYFDVPKRGAKPRQKGLTLVRDSGIGVTDAKEAVEQYGEYMDFIKLRQFLVWYTRGDILREKIRIYSEGGIVPFPGGTVFEAAYLKGIIDKTFDDLRSLGFGAIEISENVIEMSLPEKLDAISRARAVDFKVFFEYGAKYEEAPIDPVVAAADIEQFLEAGAFKVVLERSQLDATIGPKGDWPTADRLIELCERVGTENLVFEAETMEHQVWLILQLGPDVNLGPNIDPYHVVSKLEPTRAGIGRPEGYTFFKTLGATLTR